MEAPDGHWPEATAAAVAYRSAPAHRTTVGLEGSAANAAATASEITPVPPTITTVFGARRTSSARVADGTASVRTSSTGAEAADAAGPAARASG